MKYEIGEGFTELLLDHSLSFETRGFLSYFKMVIQKTMSESDIVADQSILYEKAIDQIHSEVDSEIYYRAIQELQENGYELDL